MIMSFTREQQNDSPSLYSLRRYHDIDLRRMYRADSILKDGHGYFIYEVDIHPQEASYSRRKIYFEKTFQQLEKKILRRYEEAEKVTAAIKQEKNRRSRMQSYRELMKIDYELIFLKAVHSGTEGYPFLSITQLEFMLQEKLGLGVVAEVLMERSSTPLGSIDRMEELLGKKYSLKQLQSKAAPGFFQRFKQEDYFLYTIPYGANREKHDKFLH